ncbi:hypothetical protein ERU12_00895 [Escherichia coli]|nr:hypothetical protein [Escherichia coli]
MACEISLTIDVHYLTTNGEIIEANRLFHFIEPERMQKITNFFKLILCLWVVIAITQSGYSICLYFADLFPNYAGLITWIPGILFCGLGMLAGTAASKGFGLK